MYNLHESGEDYLEAILMLKKEHGNVRSIDIVSKLGFSKPSVSIAMKKLRENNYIAMDEDGYISLLPAGEEIAKRILDRHNLLTDFLKRIGVEGETAENEACKMEHDLSDSTIDRIRELNRALNYIGEMRNNK